MALTRIQTIVTYRSYVGTQSYYFDVLIDAQGLVSVKNIRNGAGSPCQTGLPDIVLDDMQEAKDLALLLVGETEVDSGILTFTGQSELTAAVPPGVLNNTNYRVVYTPPDSALIRTESKTTTSFKAVVNCAYGTVLVPKLVPYSVLVAPASASMTGGVVTFAAADLSQKLVSFPTAYPSADYRVLLSPDGFFPARVINKTKTGFTIEIGMGLVGLQTVTVGYDVFV